MEVLKILNQKKNSIVKLVKINNKEFIVKYYLNYSRTMFIELNILSSCMHENIIKIQSILPNDPSNSIGIVMAKEDNNYMDIISENYSWEQKINHLLQIAYGLRYLHHNHIIHMDLKSENIMVTNGICKIIDFDNSEYLFNNVNVSQIKCTATHRPPEVNILFGPNFVLNYTFDIWSFGIIIFETFIGIPMHKQNNVPSYNDNNNQKKYNQKMYQYITSSKFKKDIIDVLPIKLQPCLDLNPINRPDVEEIIAILMEMIGTYKLNKFKFDSNLNLRINSSWMTNHNNSSYLYCDTIIKKFRNIINYPDCILYSIFDLVHRMNIYLDQKISYQYIHQIILLCNQFNNNKIDLDWLFCGNDDNEKIINEIIILTNGLLFQYHYYVNNCDGYLYNYKTLLSENYLTKSNSLINKLYEKY